VWCDNMMLSDFLWYLYSIPMCMTCIWRCVKRWHDAAAIRCNDSVNACNGSVNADVNAGICEWLRVSATARVQWW
jgi:hypothetical protein